MLKWSKKEMGCNLSCNLGVLSVCSLVNFQVDFQGVLSDILSCKGVSGPCKFGTLCLIPSLVSPFGVIVSLDLFSTLS